MYYDDGWIQNVKNDNNNNSIIQKHSNEKNTNATHTHTLHSCERCSCFAFGIKHDEQRFKKLTRKPFVRRIAQLLFYWIFNRDKIWWEKEKESHQLEFTRKQCDIFHVNTVCKPLCCFACNCILTCSLASLFGLSLDSQLHGVLSVFFFFSTFRASFHCFSSRNGVVFFLLHSCGQWIAIDFIASDTFYIIDSEIKKMKCPMSRHFNP